MPGRAIVVVAGGSSTRFGSDKSMAPVGGAPLIAHTVAAVRASADHCVLVCRRDQVGELSGLLEGVIVVAGGATRTRSELAGLGALPDGLDLIGIHDGARPLVPPDLVETLFATAAAVGGAVPVLTPVLPLIDRSTGALVREAGQAQTPQVFRASELLAAYRLAEAAGFEGQDTADVIASFSTLEIAAVAGSPSNVKVTFPEDLEGVRMALGASRREAR